MVNYGRFRSLNDRALTKLSKLHPKTGSSLKIPFSRNFSIVGRRVKNNRRRSLILIFFSGGHCSLSDDDANVVTLFKVADLFLVRNLGLSVSLELSDIDRPCFCDFDRLRPLLILWSFIAGLELPLTEFLNSVVKFSLLLFRSLVVFFSGNVSNFDGCKENWLCQQQLVNPVN